MTVLEVLVVDDDADIRKFLTLILQDQGFSVRNAENGKDALELIQQKKPHLIFLDLMMPVMTGDELCYTLKQNPEYRGITIFVISARTDPESQEYMKELGADEYLTKPLDTKSLVVRLEAFRRYIEDIRTTPVPGVTAGGPADSSLPAIDLPPLELKPASSGTLRIPVEERYGAFRVESLVGSGGMGHVFKGFDERLERHVAVKVLSPKISDQPDSVERFRREAVTLATLNHPGIANIFLFGEEKGQYYFAMQWCGGGSLLDRIRKEKRIAPIAALDIVLQTARGLEAAESRGVIHRDVKPSNIMFDENQTIKIVDFGLAFHVGTSEHLTHEGEFLGSPSYVSPEQATSSHVDHRSDIYSLGITFYHMLYGKVPFRGKNSVETVLMHVKEPFPEFDPDQGVISHSLYRIIQGMTEKDPSRRYQKYAELIKDIERVRSGLVAESSFKMPAALHPTTLQSLGTDLFRSLCTLFRENQSGALQFRDHETIWIFLLHHGEIVYFESNHGDDSVGIAFYRRGWLRRKDLPVDSGEMTEEAFAKILENPRFTVRQMSEFLTQHVRNVIEKLLNIPGDISFRNAEIENPFLHLKIGEIILEHIRRFDDAGKFLDVFPESGTLVKVDGYEKILKNLIWKPEESFILSRIEGPDITTDMLQILTGLPEAVIARTVYALENMGAIQWQHTEQKTAPASSGRANSVRDRVSPPADAGETRPQPKNAEDARVDVNDFMVRIEYKKSEKMVKDEHHTRVANQFYELAQEKFAEGDYWKVTELCRQAIANYPNEAQYHILMAQAFARHPKFLKDAENSFLKALELAPWNPDYHAEFAEFYWKQGLSIRAWNECKKTLEILPEHEKGRALFKRLKKEKKH